MAEAHADLRRWQELTRDALERAVPRHRRYRALQALYRTGSLRVAQQVEAGQVFSEFDLSEEVVNLTLPHVNLIIATAVAQDPKLLAVPVGGGPEAEDYAATVEGVVNHYWKRTRSIRAFRAAAQDCVILGDGFVKSGWAHVGEEDELDDDELLAAAADALEEDRLLADLADEPASPVEDVLEAVDLSVERVEVDEPWTEYASPFDIFVPPGATEMADTPWVIHRITRPIEDVADTFGVDVEDLNSDTNVSDDGHLTPAEWRRREERERESGRNLGDAYPTATYFEAWDLANRRLVIFQESGDEFLYDSDEDEDGDFPHSHTRPPFTHIRNYRAAGTDFWGFGDVENIANLQQMVNELFTLQMDNARRSGNVVFLDDDYNTQEVRDALESDHPDVIVPLKLKQQKTLQEVLYVARRDELSSDVYAVKRDVEDYLQRVLGINDFQAGGVGADRMSATAAAVVDSVASLRAADKVRAIEEAASNHGTTLLLLCQEFLEEPRAIRIAGQVAPVWVDVDRDALRGEYLIEVEAGSTRQETPQTRENRGLQLLREVAPTLVELGYDPAPVVRQAIRALGYDPDLLMQPMPAPPMDPAGGAPPEAGPGGAPSEEDLLAMLSDPSFAEGSAAKAVFDRGGPPTALAAQTAGQPLV